MVRSLDAEGFSPYGRVIDAAAQLGTGQTDTAPADTALAGTGQPGFWSAETAFVSASSFDPGAEGTVDLLWVTYDRAERPSTFEVHLHTEQALIPISGSVVQHVFRPDHNGGEIESFQVDPGQGIVMDPGCYHTTTSLGGFVTCLMVSRESTTRDLAAGLQDGREPTESVYVRVEAPS